MNTTRYSLIGTVAFWLTTATLCAQTVLYSDNFNRTAEAGGDVDLLNNVDFSLTGMGGLLISNGTLTVSSVWVEPVDDDSGNDARSVINTNNQLELAVGYGTSHVFVDNNFASQIATSGVLSVQVEVPTLPTGETTPLHRYLGMGIGGSRTVFSGAGDRVLARGADLFVALTEDGRIRINDEVPTTRAQSGDLAPSDIIDLDDSAADFIPGILRVDLKVPNTTYGTTVLYDVFFDDGSGFRPVASNRTFAWSGQDELYIGLGARTGVAATGDDFSIAFTEQSVSPQVFFKVTPDVAGNATTVSPVTLEYSTYAVPFGSTYGITADKPVNFPYSDQNGYADYPYPIQAEVNGMLGDVTFTINISNSVPELIATATATVKAVDEAPVLVAELFTDNYNRAYTIPDLFDIDSGTDGMGGTLSPLTYLETLEMHNIATTNYNNDSTLIGFDNFGNEVCSMANIGMSAWGLDYNFTNEVILTDGGFSIGLDVTGINSVTGDGADRYSGFGVGLSLDEINAFEDENSTSLGPRGTIQPDTANAGPRTGVADFYASLSIQGNVQVFAGGVLVGQYPVSTNVGRLRVDFSVPDFNAGSFVGYQVYFNDLFRTSGFFRWSATDQNYVGVSSRGTLNVTVDNLAIGTVNVSSSAPVALPDLSPTITSLLPAGTPPYTNAVVQFSSASNVTYRLDYAPSLTNAFMPVPGGATGTLAPTATDSTTTARLDLPTGFETNGFIRIHPVHWPEPVLP